VYGIATDQNGPHGNTDPKGPHRNTDPKGPRRINSQSGAGRYLSAESLAEAEGPPTS